MTPGPHESQKVTRLPDGSLEITFRVAGLDEIKRWILSYGPEATVLEPDKLRNMVRQGLNKNLSQYRVSRPSINLLRVSQAS